MYIKCSAVVSNVVRHIKETGKLGAQNFLCVCVVDKYSVLIYCISLIMSLHYYTYVTL